MGDMLSQHSAGQSSLGVVVSEMNKNAPDCLVRHMAVAHASRRVQGQLHLIIASLGRPSFAPHQVCLQCSKASLIPSRCLGIG